MSTLYAKDFKTRETLTDREARIDCAAAHRLIAHFKLDDLIYSHITMRVPGATDQFYIAPHGLWFHEVTASSLKVCNLQGDVLDQGSRPDLPHSRFATMFHAPLYKARPDIQATMHMHTQAGVAVSMMECGLITTNHTSMHFHDGIAYHGYEGDFTRGDEGDRVVSDLGDANVLILRSHGLVTVGDTMAAAFNRMYYLEFLCRVQIDALGSGQKLIVPDDDLRKFMGEKYRKRDTPISGFEWPAMLRLMDSLDPSFRD